MQQKLNFKDLEFKEEPRHTALHNQFRVRELFTGSFEIYYLSTLVAHVVQRGDNQLKCVTSNCPDTFECDHVLAVKKYLDEKRDGELKNDTI